MNKKIISGLIASTVIVSGCAMIKDNLGFGDNQGVKTSTDPARSPIGTPSLEKLTVGDVLQRGGTQLTAAQIKQLAGSTLEGMGTDSRWRAQTAMDGTMRGTSYGKDKSEKQFSGKWWVDNSERLCMVNETLGAGPDCSFLYRLQGNYYASPSNTREAPVVERSVFR